MKQIVLGNVIFVLACTAQITSAFSQEVAARDPLAVHCESQLQEISLCAKTGAQCLKEIESFAMCLDSEITSFSGSRRNKYIHLTLQLGSEPSMINLSFFGTGTDKRTASDAKDQEYEFKVGKCVRPNQPDGPDANSGRWALVILPEPDERFPTVYQRYFGFTNANCDGHNATASAANPALFSSVLVSYIDVGPFGNFGNSDAPDRLPE